MKRFSTAHKAALAHAREHGREDEFNVSCLTYADNLIESGVLVELGGRKDRWRLITGDSWFVVDETDTAGPYATKSDAMAYLGVDSTTYVDTGVYSADVNGDIKYVVRYNAAIEYGMDLGIDLEGA